MLFYSAVGKPSYLQVHQTATTLVSMDCIWKRLERPLVDQRRSIFLSMIDADEGSWDGLKEGFAKACGYSFSVVMHVSDSLNMI